MKGTDYFVNYLRDLHVRHLFGNPGHTELTLLDRLAETPEMTYVLGLHEGGAMAMADGYAIASGGLGVFCGHIAPGLGNSLGMLFDASKHGSPLLVTVGQQDGVFNLTEPFLWGDLVQMAKPVTKWAYEVRSVQELERALQRAVKVALTPPTGPVLLSLPKDVMSGESEFGPPVATRVAPGPCADADAIREAARLLVAARLPMIIAGDEVGKSEAEADLHEVAQALGCPVLSETASIRFNFPIESPLYQGTLARMQKDVRTVLERADIVFSVGAEVFTMAAAARTEPLPSTVRLIQLNIDSWQLGKNYAAQPALWGDPKATLRRLADEIRQLQDDKGRQAASDRVAALAKTRAAKLMELDGLATRDAAKLPMTGAVAMRHLVEALPDNAVVVDESSTTGLTLRALLARRPLTYFGLKGGGLGWGLPASIGVQLAMPDRPVVAVVGDGAALFSVQALWTAAHHRCRVVFVICNNAQYRLIKHRLHLFGGGASARAGCYLGSELNDPAIDFVALAQSMGVPACHVEKPADLPSAMQTGLGRQGPYLIDLRVEGSYPELTPSAPAASPADA